MVAACAFYNFLVATIVNSRFAYIIWILKNKMYHYSQLASAIRGEQWFDT